MKLGVATMLAAPDLTLEEVAAWAGAERLDCLAVNCGPTFARPGRPHGHLDVRAVLRAGPEPVQALLARHGLELCALAPMLNALDADPQVRAARSAELRQTIEAAALLGVRTVVTYAGSPAGMYFRGLPGLPEGVRHPSDRTEEALDRFAQVYGPLADYAAARGVRLAFETAPRGGGWGNLAHCPELWERMFSLVPSPALGLAFDPSHLVWLGITPIEPLVREFAARIFQVDAKDCELLPDRLARQGILGNRWWRYRLPGHGRLDWPNLIAALRAVGFAGALVIENEDERDPGLVGCARAARYLRGLIGPPAPPDPA